MSPLVKYTIFFFAPLWLVCSFTYQAALLYSSVSSVNLLSSSSSLFVLVLAALVPPRERLTAWRLFLVLLNLLGVAIVSKVSSSLTGSALALISAFAYAVYLTAYSSFQARGHRLDINLVFGSVGVLSLLVGPPLLVILDALSVESLRPLPTPEQLFTVLLSGLFGTLLADVLWLKAASLTDSLSASLSLTLQIPFSLLADTLFRLQPPSLVQVLAAIPIGLSFAGSARSSEERRKEEEGSGGKEEDSERLLDTDSDSG